MIDLLILPCVPVPAPFVSPVIETFPELLTPETDQIFLEAGDERMDNGSADNTNFNLNCIDNMDFELHFSGYVALTPFQCPSQSRSSTPCKDEQPALPLFPDVQESVVLFSPLCSDRPTLQDFVDPPEFALEDQETSAEISEVSAEVRDLIYRP